MKRLHANPYLLLTLTALFWAGNMVMGRGIRGDVPPIALAFWRWTIALILLAPLALPHLRSQWSRLQAAWPTVVVLGLLGLLGVGCYNTFAYLALQHTTATSATLLNSFIPVATLAFGFLLFGKRLRRAEVMGVMVSLYGVAAIVNRGSIDTLLALSLNTGDLWMLAAVTVWGLYTVGLQKRPEGVDPMLMLTAFTVIGLLALTPAYVWELSSGRSISLNLASFGGIPFCTPASFPAFLAMCSTTWGSRRSVRHADRCSFI